MEQFIDFCILSGCDYGAKINGVASGKGLQYIRKYNNINGIIDAMRCDKISYRPDDNLTLDEYQIKYNRVYSIFYERQEKVLKQIDDKFAYCINFDLKQWLIVNTNYVALTLDKKLMQLSSPYVPVDPAKAPPFSKIKISVKKKHST